MLQDNIHSDKELLAQVAEGDEKAFGTLFSGYYQPLFNYIFGFIKSKQVTEEIVMDVFLKIWLGREFILQIEKFDAFLFRVAHNKSVDFLRTLARDREFQDLLWDHIQLTNNIEADSSLIVKEYETKLREAVSLLSPQRKKVYQLSREQDMTHDQIAVQLNISKFTVNNHIVEAQRFVRSYLYKNSDVAFMVLLVPWVIVK